MFGSWNQQYYKTCFMDLYYIFLIIKLSANNGQSCTHRIDRSGPERFNDGINLRDWLKPGHSKLNKAESVLIFM